MKKIVLIALVLLFVTVFGFSITNYLGPTTIDAGLGVFMANINFGLTYEMMLLPKFGLEHLVEVGVSFPVWNVGFDFSYSFYPLFKLGKKENVKFIISALGFSVGDTLMNDYRGHFLQFGPAEKIGVQFYPLKNSKIILSLYAFLEGAFNFLFYKHIAWYSSNGENYDTFQCWPFFNIVPFMGGIGFSILFNLNWKRDREKLDKENAS